MFIFKKMKINKKGISTMVESAAMFIVIAMILSLVLQINVWSLAQIAVKNAAYESARGGAKVGAENCVVRANTIAHQHGKSVGIWSPTVTVTSNGSTLTVIVKQKVPIIGKLFNGLTVQGISRQIIEETA